MEQKSKKTSLKILAIQMSSKIGDKEANFHKVLELVNKNIKNDVDILLLPEVWTVGWKPRKFVDVAEDMESGDTFEFLSEIARVFNVNVIGGSYITKKGDELFNTCPVINRSGELIAYYNKMHLFSYYGCDEGTFIKKGINPLLVDIDGIKIGITICYDIRFPELYRAYRNAGADVLVNVAAWPMSRAVHWDALSTARAVENQSYMIALTQSGLIEGDEWNLGHSKVIDYNGEVISEIKDVEGAMLAEIEFDEMYKFREKCTVLVDIHDAYDVQ